MSSYAKVLKVPQQAGWAVVSSEIEVLSRVLKDSLKREIIEEISPHSNEALTLYGSGAAEVLLSSDESLDELVSNICTPKGTTIEGVKVFDERKVAAAVRDAVKAVAKRARELSR